jgi:hypothetical protein
MGCRPPICLVFAGLGFEALGAGWVYKVLTFLDFLEGSILQGSIGLSCFILS